MNGAPPRRARGGRWRLALASAGFALVLAAGAVEAAARLAPGVVGVDPRRARNVRSTLLHDEGPIRSHPFLGYHRFGVPRGDGVNYPFIGVEHGREKDPETLRVACVGGSTTAGGYPDHLEERLGERLDRPVEVMNWGVVGWTSAETLGNYFLSVQDYRPDVVVLLHAVNDANPRWLQGFARDYAHYRRPFERYAPGAGARAAIAVSDFVASRVGGQLNSAGIADRVRRPAESLGSLAPGTHEPFLRNVRTVLDHARRHDALPVVLTMPWSPDEALSSEGVGRLRREGIVEHNAMLRELAAERAYLLVDAERRAQDEPAALGEWRDLVHLYDPGQRELASWVADALTAALSEDD